MGMRMAGLVATGCPPAAENLPLSASANTLVSHAPRAINMRISHVPHVILSHVPHVLNMQMVRLVGCQAPHLPTGVRFSRVVEYTLGVGLRIVRARH